MKGNGLVRTLRLRGDAIEDAGAVAIANMLKQNAVLHTLVLRYIRRFPLASKLSRASKIYS